MSNLLKSALICALLTSGTQGFAKDTDAAIMQNATQFATNYDAGFDGIIKAWPSYRLSEIPKIIVLRNSDNTVSGLISVDHPNPDKLGTATEIASDKATIHLITNPQPHPELDNLEHYNFDVNVGDANTFVIASNCSDLQALMDCMAGQDYIAYFVHEAFHQFQNNAFKRFNFVDQEQYDYSAEHLHSVLLENALMVEMSKETDNAALTAQARDLVALRAWRHANFPLTALDESQERIEGTARYIEERVESPSRLPSAEELQIEVQAGEVKEQFGWGRFYASGAVVLDLLQRLEVPNITQKIEESKTPMQVMAEAFPVSTDQIADIVVRLKVALDPTGAFMADAQKYAEYAKTEPGIFDDHE